MSTHLLILFCIVVCLLPYSSFKHVNRFLHLFVYSGIFLPHAIRQVVLFSSRVNIFDRCTPPFLNSSQLFNIRVQHRAGFIKVYSYLCDSNHEVTEIE